MRIRIIIIVLAVAAAVAVPGLLPASLPTSYPDPERIGPIPDTGAAISLFEQRVATDPNAINLTILAQLQARRTRETGDVAELAKAEANLRQALGQQPNYGPAAATFASVQAALHNFDEALITARRAHDLNPRLGALALVGDVLVATGEYDEAAAAYAELSSTSPSPGLTARLAHLDELSGRTEEAIIKMERAATAHLEMGGVGEEAAWYQVRLGDLNLSIGQLSEADRRYRAALTVLPGYWSALAGRARVSAARGDLGRAIELNEQAAAVVPRPEVLIALGDLYTATGRPDLAADRYATVEAIARLAGGVYDRTLALYLAEHGRATEALALAETGLETRQDIYGYDTLAWALYHLGNTSEARKAMDTALALGTRDAQLLFHSGMISLAAGDREQAATELAAALDLNPNFHPLHAVTARELLKEATG
ncbi:MAG: tetratricopeptide repeat protein [Actinomycetota bacterium]